MEAKEIFQKEGEYINKKFFSDLVSDHICASTQYQKREPVQQRKKNQARNWQFKMIFKILPTFSPKQAKYL